jgi:hypothetical protein
VNNRVLRETSKEHVEAVVEEAMRTWYSLQDRRGTIIVVNPRRIVVILEELANRGALLPLELIEPALDDSTRTSIQTWLAAPSARLYAIRTARSWFFPHDSGSTKSGNDVVEPADLCTNMTYDTGRPPGD